MHIGILQTGHAPDQIRAVVGDYDAMFHRFLAGHDFTFTTWDVVDGVFPEAPDAAEGWLVTGSRHGAYEDHDWIPPLEDLIRAIQAAGRPLVGVCFGHQIIAQALGGRVEKFDGGWSVGRQTYDWGAETLALNAWHQDQVIAPPAAATILARNDFCAYAAMAIGSQTLTVQAHPEFDADTVDLLIRHRGKGVVPDAQLDHARDGLARPVDRDVLAQRIAAHFLTAEVPA